MDGVVVNYRGGMRTQNTRQMILMVSGVNDRSEAEKLLGKSVEWTSPGGKKIQGSITRIHGGNGCVVACFEKGLPGQALGTKVNILQ